MEISPSWPGERSGHRQLGDIGRTCESIDAGHDGSRYDLDHGEILLPRAAVDRWAEDPKALDGQNGISNPKTKEFDLES
jgi:hypothetical protein